MTALITERKNLYKYIYGDLIVTSLREVSTQHTPNHVANERLIK